MDRDYEKWQTSCECCDSININVIPYTYREYGGCVGREYNCAICSGLSNRTTHKVSEQYHNNGVESAIDLLIVIDSGKYKDEEDIYFCNTCECDLRVVGVIGNGEFIILINHEDKINTVTVDEYNKLEEQREKEIEGYFPNYYPTEPVHKANKTNGYRCFECNTKIKENRAKELLKL